LTFTFFLYYTAAKINFTGKLILAGHQVQEMLDELNKQTKDMWIPGKFIGIDKYALGFQELWDKAVHLLQLQGVQLPMSFCMPCLIQLFVLFRHEPPATVND